MNADIGSLDLTDEMRKLSVAWQTKYNAERRRAEALCKLIIKTAQDPRMNPALGLELVTEANSEME